MNKYLLRAAAQQCATLNQNTTPDNAILTEDDKFLIKENI